MWGVISKLLGSDKVIENASKGIDKMFFTNEEKAETWVQTLKAYEPFKIAQRLIALIVTSVYLLVWIMSAIGFVLSFWFSEILILSKDLAALNNDVLGLPFTLIIGFYFGGGMAEGIVSQIKKRSKS